MWSAEHSIETAVASERIWRVWSDVGRWPEWNDDIEAIELDGPFAVGSRIAMTPRAGAPIVLRLAEVVEPVLFVDEADLGDILVRTIHRVGPIGGSRVGVTYRIEISGPAANVLGPKIGPDISRDFPQVLAALVAHATS